MPPERHRRRPLFLIALAALFVVAAGTGFYASWRSIRKAALGPPAPQRDIGQPTATKIDRGRFFVVGFPVDAGATLRPPATNAAPAVPLRRAVLLSLGELDEARDGTVGVWEGDIEYTVEVRSLTFVPPGNAGELVDSLNAAIRTWGADTDWRRVRIERGDAGGDGVHVRLVLTDRRGRHEAYDYSVRGDAVVPTARSRIDR